MSYLKKSENKIENKKRKINYNRIEGLQILYSGIHRFLYGDASDFDKDCCIISLTCDLSVQSATFVILQYLTTQIKI